MVLRLLQLHDGAAAFDRACRKWRLSKSHIPGVEPSEFVSLLIEHLCFQGDHASYQAEHRDETP